MITKREKEIFNLLVLYFNTKEIADILEISDKTVRNHISNVIQKLNVSNRLQAILELIKLNEIEFRWFDD